MESVKWISDLFEEHERLYHLCLFYKLKEEKIHYGQIPVLLALAERDGCNQCALATALNVSRASIGVSLRRMEKVGLVRRETCREDARYNTVYITDEGKRILEKAKEVLESTFRGTLEGVTPDELEAFRNIMEKMNRNISAMRDELKKK